MLLLGGGAAALLQLAHPAVAWAIEHHSTTRQDPRGRFRRTFAHVFAMVYGDLDHAIASARRVHALHSHVTGAIEDRPPARYDANEARALAWVYATLVHTSVTVYELAVAKLATAERDRYVDENRRLAALFAIPDELLPRTWSELAALYAETLPTLRVTAPAREIARVVLAPPSATMAIPSALYAVATAALLPEPLRDGFGLRFGRRERVTFRALVLGLRASLRVMPRSARYFPAYLAAERRVGHRSASPRVSRWLHRTALGVALRGGT